MAFFFSRLFGLAASNSGKARNSKARRGPRRTLLLESLENRNLMSVTPFQLNWKSVDFTAAGTLTGSLKGGYIPTPFAASVTGPITITGGTITYSGQNGTGKADVSGSLVATIAGRPAGNMQFTKSGQDVTESNGRITIVLDETSGTPLTGTFNTKDFSVVATTTLQKTNASGQTATGPGTWKGTITPTNNSEAFDVAVSATPNWQGLTVAPGVLSVDVDLKATGPVQKAATRTTPVATLTLAWVDAAGKSVGKISDKIDLLWNQAGGSYRISGLPTPPDKATQLLLTTMAGRTILDQTRVALPPKPVLSISNASVDDPPAGTTVNMVFTVTLSSSNGATQFAPVTVKYKTVNGTAKSGLDYTAVSAGTLTFAKGETQKTITIKVKRDATPLNESFFVQLMTPVYATLDVANSKGTGTIIHPVVGV